MKKTKTKCPKCKRAVWKDDVGNLMEFWGFAWVSHLLQCDWRSK